MERRIEYAVVGSDRMQIIRGLSLMKALEKAGYNIPQQFTEELFETILDQAASQGVRVPFKRYDHYTKRERRALETQIVGKKFDLPSVGIERTKKTKNYIVDVHGKTFDEIFDAVCKSRRKL